MNKISVVINTLNEEENLPRALSSVEGLADEIVVVDMKSEDDTVAVAESFGARVYEHERVGYVEPARNFAISKATGAWILILDADEEVGKSLSLSLRKIAQKPKADYYRIARKNIIFGKWMKHSRWWPDYNIRFFKKGYVSWNEIIHSVPMTQGRGADLPNKEEFAIVHTNYVSIEQYLERMNRYTTIEAKNLATHGYKFIWKDLIRKPLEEFLSRYFAGEGYKDGVHGLSVAMLQAFSEFVLYFKVWQKEKFLEQAISLSEVRGEADNATRETNWWLNEASIKSKDFLSSIPERISRKFFGKK